MVRSQGQPRCLWRTGTVPKGFLPQFQSVCFNQAENLQEPSIESQTVIRVYTDGSGYKAAGVLLAGFGVHFPQMVSLDSCGPLHGPVQTVQRAELRAVCCAIEKAPSRISIVSDSSYVVHGISKMLSGSTHIPSRHADLWTFVCTHIGLIHSVQWIRAHIHDPQTAQQQGFLVEDWAGNQQADSLAKKGAFSHGGNPQMEKAYASRLQMVRAIQCHMLNTWTYVQTTP